MLFSEIPQFTRHASWGCDVSWEHLVKHWLPDQLKDGLQLDPDFQRAHVWSEEQQRRYIEFVLRGGRSSRDVQTNHPGWHTVGKGDYVLVDGKQRIEAVCKFMRNELAIFGGHYRNEYTDWLRHYASFRWNVNDLQTRAEVLQWYLDLNAGGVAHTDEEIERVRELLEREHGTR